MAKRPLPTAELLRQLLDYDADTGILTWRPRRHDARWTAKYAGQSAGAHDRLGYVSIKINDKSYLAHRVAWVIVHGYWPDVVDHINGNPRDNRIINLRDVSHEMNQRNQKRHCSNTSGRTGVSWNRFRNCWTAQIKIAGQSIHLGSHQSFEEAVRVREIAEQHYGFTGRV